MKNLYACLVATLLLFGGLPHLVAAQDAPAAKKNVVGLSPLGLYEKVKVKYERVLSSSLSVGAMVGAFHGDYPGVQLSPFVRYYFEEAAPRGWYVQAQVGVYHHRRTYTTARDDPGNQTGAEYTDTYRFTNIGTGGAVGYQWFLGKRKNLTIDAHAGLKLYKTGIKDYDESLSSLDWQLQGPGSYFNGLLSFGYAF